MKKVVSITIFGIIFSSAYCIGIKYTTELEQAYNWAHDNGITTQPDIYSANMGGKITRAELAKIISNYAINILGKEINSSKDCNFNDVSDELDAKFDHGITHACQLGLMGQNINDFRPNDQTTRAEFGTVLSRALWGEKNGGGSTYYENHLKALKFEGIMTKIDSPMDKEVRGYVMLMLMRSYNPDYNQSYNDEDYTEYDEISHIIGMLD